MDGMQIVRVLGTLLLWCIASLAPAADFPSVYPQARTIFPDAEAYGGFEGKPPSVAAYRGGRIIGYLFLTEDVLRIPAYSGKHINTMVGIDPEGRIVGLSIVQHDEPILAVGITQDRLNRYVAQYEGKSAYDRVTIGAERKGYVAIDGITGATITVMVQNATVMRSVKLVAEARGIRNPGLAGSADGSQATEQPRLAQQSSPALFPATPSRSAVESAAVPEVAGIRARADRSAGGMAPGWSAPETARPDFSRQTPPLVHGVVPLSRDMPPQVIAPLPARPGTWTPPQEEPAWIAIWQNRTFDIAVLVIGLATLSFILVFQDWLAKYPAALIYVRNGFHVYTLFFIGWWGLAQLSVINVLTFVTSFMQGFQWENFLIDPMLFILWGFVAMTLLLWGRGVYCGWLCPFGALQELILIASRKLKLPEVEFSDAVHERLVALKYIILILLFGVSLQSIAEAAWYAEVEPFKTVISMRFNREWNYVLYAVILIGVAAVNRKFYCKYLCPLGAALAIPGRFRLFEWWLRRRKECGKPCQVCANRCSVRAIRPTGEINANECHYCLDCQVIYYNDKVCLPLIDRRKRREQQLVRGRESGANNPLQAMDTSREHSDGILTENKH
ncbi:MAG: 4Fe-4S binding protein [Betaproteobacteria bacterium]|nr:4Fe-4S binding protein [Betaproteobacteria bacterium]